MSNIKELENVLIASYSILYQRFFAPENITVFPPHWHKRTEILHIVKGKLEITIDDETLTLEEDDFCYIRSAAPHTGISRSDNLEYEMVQFRENENQQVLGSCKELLPLAEGDIEIAVRFKDDYIATLFNHISDYYKINSNFQNTLFLGIMYEIYAHLAIKHSSVKKLSTYSDNNFSKAVRYIENNFTAISSVSKVAEEFSFEPTYFSRTFKKKMGVTANHYVCCLKLEESEKLLATTDLTTEIISQQCGFGSASYFTKCFTKRYNMTPIQYKKMNQNLI